MQLSDLNLVISLIGTMLSSAFTAMDTVEFVTAPRITLLDLELGLTVFGEIWYFVINIKDGEA